MLSARRKKSVLGRRLPRTRRIAPESSEGLARVLKAKLEEPPSGFIPAATAIASSSVDLPLPFSPIRYVTLGCSPRPPVRAAIAGNSHGHPSRRSEFSGRSNLSERTKASSIRAPTLTDRRSYDRTRLLV